MSPGALSGHCLPTGTCLRTSRSRNNHGYKQHHHPERPRQQPEEHNAGNTQAQGGRLHRGLRLRQVVPAVRYHLHRSPAAAHRDLLHLCPQAAAQALPPRCGRHPQSLHGHGHRPEEDGHQPTQHRGDCHRSEHLPTAPVLAPRHAVPWSFIPVFLQPPPGHVRALPRPGQDGTGRPGSVPGPDKINPRWRHPAYPLQTRQLPVE